MEKTVLNKAQVKNLTNGIAKEGIVEVRLRNPKRTGTIAVRGFYEVDANGTHKWRELVDSEGEPRVVKIQRKLILRMANENDRILYAHLLVHPKYVKSPTPILQLVNVEEQAKSFISHREIKSDAEEIIKKATQSQLQDLARVMMINVRPDSSVTVLKRELYDFIDFQDNKAGKSNAERLVEEVNSEDYEMKVIFRKAIELKIITNSLNRLMYNNSTLATTFDSLVEWGRNNKDLVAEIAKQVK